MDAFIIYTLINYLGNSVMRYGLINLQVLQQQIAECAYYKWLAGSTDKQLNWFEAEYEILMYWSFV